MSTLSIFSCSLWNYELWDQQISSRRQHGRQRHAAIIMCSCNISVLGYVSRSYRMLLNYETRITILIFNLKFFAFFCFGSSSDASAAYVIVLLNTIWCHDSIWLVDQGRTKIYWRTNENSSYVANYKRTSCRFASKPIDSLWIVFCHLWQPRQILFTSDTEAKLLPVTTRTSMDPILTKMEMSLMGSGWNDSDINKLNSHNHITLCEDGAGGSNKRAK